MATIEDDRHFYAFEDINPLRSQFAQDTSVIRVTDLGVGSQVSNHKQRSISSIYKSAVSGRRKSELLFRICLFLQPRNILEFGTSLGISSRYLHAATPNASITTIEGCPNIFDIAKRHLSQIDQIDQIQSDFDSFLEDKTHQEHYDLIYIDGNHQYEATLRYAKQLRNKQSAQSIMIFDDIYWSKGMSEAWTQIKKRKIFDATLDYYQFGLGIIHEDVRKYQDITVRPSIFRGLKMLK